MTFLFCFEGFFFGGVGGYRDLHAHFSEASGLWRDVGGEADHHFTKGKFK